MVTDDRKMTERIMALGEYNGVNDPVAVIKDTFSVLATLIQSDEYCWCQTLPCECAMVLFGDLIECMEARHPALKATRLAEQGQP